MHCHHHLMFEGQNIGASTTLLVKTHAFDDWNSVPIGHTERVIACEILRCWLNPSHGVVFIYIYTYIHTYIHTLFQTVIGVYHIFLHDSTAYRHVYIYIYIVHIAHVPLGPHCGWSHIPHVGDPPMIPCWLLQASWEPGYSSWLEAQLEAIWNKNVVTTYQVTWNRAWNVKYGNMQHRNPSEPQGPTGQRRQPHTHTLPNPSYLYCTS